MPTRAVTAIFQPVPFILAIIAYPSNLSGCASSELQHLLCEPIGRDLAVPFLDLDADGLDSHRLTSKYCRSSTAEGIEHCREMIETDPSHPLGYMGLADALSRKGMFDDAVAAAENAARLAGPAAGPAGILAMCHAGAGNTVRAREILDELTERSQNGYVSGFWLAVVHAALGEMDQAFESLARARKDRDSSLLYITVVPRSIGVRQDPRFEALLQDIGLGHLMPLL